MVVVQNLTVMSLARLSRWESRPAGRVSMGLARAGTARREQTAMAVVVKALKSILGKELGRIFLI